MKKLHVLILLLGMVVLCELYVLSTVGKLNTAYNACLQNSKTNPPLDPLSLPVINANSAWTDLLSSSYTSISYKGVLTDIAIDPIYGKEKTFYALTFNQEKRQFFSFHKAEMDVSTFILNGKKVEKFEDLKLVKGDEVTLTVQIDTTNEKKYKSIVLEKNDKN